MAFQQQHAIGLELPHDLNAFMAAVTTRVRLHVNSLDEFNPGYRWYRLSMLLLAAAPAAAAAVASCCCCCCCCCASFCCCCSCCACCSCCCCCLVLLLLLLLLCLLLVLLLLPRVAAAAAAAVPAAVCLPSLLLQQSPTVTILFLDHVLPAPVTCCFFSRTNAKSNPRLPPHQPLLLLQSYC